MMNLFSGVLACCLRPRFVLLCGLGSAAGLLVGAIPGLSVTMATALLVSVTYAWPAGDALAAVMGVYVVGVFSGALSAILLNIPGAPASVVTALDGYPLARRGEARRALRYAAVYSFVGSVFGLTALALLAEPISAVALRFQPMDCFLLAVCGLTAVGGLGGGLLRGLLSAAFGIFFALIGMDPVLGTPRLTFGVAALGAGIPTVPALVGLFGFAEVLSSIGAGRADAPPGRIGRQRVPLRELLRELPRSLLYCLTGAAVGALPGAGGPVAAFLAYAQAKRLVRKPSRPFGEGAVEGIAASESANNACVGGALIPMLTLGVPGDAVTAVLLAVFHVHGLRPGPMFLASGAESFCAILAGGFLGSGFLLLLGLFAAPRLAGLLRVPPRLLLPVVAVLCVVGAYAAGGRLFDVGLMLFFGLLGYAMRRRGYPVAPMTLGLVLGGMMDANLRRAVSLAASAENVPAALFGRPVTLALLALALASLAAGLRRAVQMTHA